MDREVGFMEMDLFEKIIDEISGFSEPVRKKEIELFHFGESLLHPRIHDMAGYASGKGLNVCLSVNAPELTPQLLDRLASSGPCRIIISFDGYDAESYRKIRGSAADYEKGSANLRYAAGLLKKNGLAATKISLRVIRLNANNPRIDEVREYWESLGLPVEVREFFPWTEKELSSLGIVQKYPPFMPCPFPWQYLVVQWDGTVVPCCRDYNGVNQMGNVRGSSLKEIWNSPRYADFRAQHRTGEYGCNGLCRGCMEIFYTEA
jgi:radical SAM protein with 4Fe4S-binding SPASM domain